VAVHFPQIHVWARGANEGPFGPETWYSRCILKCAMSHDDGQTECFPQRLKVFCGRDIVQWVTVCQSIVPCLV